jgi:Activator of Hsp90 ATPase homolog 1-like protein
LNRVAIFAPADGASLRERKSFMRSAVKPPVVVTLPATSNETDHGPMPMKLEAWPGGRWYRDLGSGNGHLWGHVQSIKRPTLLEIYGPLFMPYAVASNLQYRLSEQPGGTLIKFQHSALGFIQDEHRANVGKGWSHIHSRLRALAEAKRP